MLLAFALAVCPLLQDPKPVARDGNGADGWFTREQAQQCSAAADRGLRWLAAQQSDTGCWTGLVGHKQEDDYVLLDTGLPVDAQRRTGHGHLGVTALCGMAFLASGSLPDRGPHAAVVQKTLDYVNRQARENGYLTDAGSRMYEHAFATLFLAEVYGMAATEATKSTLERAVNLIVDCQNEYGGWRYNPFDRELDLSVTVCQVQALRAARNIGIRVPSGTIDKAMAYVTKSRVPSGSARGLFYYKLYGPRAPQKPTEYAINAAALTALACAGVHDDDIAEPVLTFLARGYPQLADYYRTHFYYWYGNYYAAQAFYQYRRAAPARVLRPARRQPAAQPGARRPLAQRRRAGRRVRHRDGVHPAADAQAVPADLPAVRRRAAAGAAAKSRRTRP
ncbi:MAG: hypothetical protein QM775_24970 [Pirellulales bacterium]